MTCESKIVFMFPLIQKRNKSLIHESLDMNLCL